MIDCAKLRKLPAGDYTKNLTNSEVKLLLLEANDLIEYSTWISVLERRKILKPRHAKKARKALTKRANKLGIVII